MTKDLKGDSRDQMQPKRMSNSHLYVQRYSVYETPSDFVSDTLKAFELCRILIEWAQDWTFENSFEANYAGLADAGAKTAFLEAHEEFCGNGTIAEILQVSSDIDSTGSRTISKKSRVEYCRNLLLAVPVFKSYINSNDMALSIETCATFMADIKAFYKIQRLETVLVRGTSLDGSEEINPFTQDTDSTSSASQVTYWCS